VLSKSLSTKINATPQFFLQTCIFPRCVQSPEDAVFCAKFIKLLHSIKTPNLSTIVIYNMIINSLGPMVFSRTEQEAKHLGQFLAEMLGTLNKWAKDADVFKRECETFPGFLNPPKKESDKKDGDKKNDVITFDQYQKCVNGWHKKLSEAFCRCIESSEGVEVHNALTILSGLVPGAFPIHDTYHKDVKEKVAKMTDEKVAKRFGHSIIVMAKSINARLQMCEDSMIKGPKKRKVEDTAAAATVDKKVNGDKISAPPTSKNDKKDPPVAPAAKKTDERKEERAKADDERTRKRGRGEDDIKKDDQVVARTVRAKKEEGGSRDTPPSRGGEAKTSFPDARGDSTGGARGESKAQTSTSGGRGESKSSGKKEEVKRDERKEDAKDRGREAAKSDADVGKDKKDDKKDDRRDSKGEGGKRDRSPPRGHREKLVAAEGEKRGGSPASAGKGDDKAGGSRDAKRMRREDEDKGRDSPAALPPPQKGRDSPAALPPPRDPAGERLGGRLGFNSAAAGGGSDREGDGRGARGGAPPGGNFADRERDRRGAAQLPPPRGGQRGSR
jgi:THO complex subunit 2